MNFADLVAGDPLSTSLDRAVAAGNSTIGGWEMRVARATWSLLTAAERAELGEYWQAVRDNDIWNAERDRDWLRKTFYSSRLGRHVGETDGEWRVRTAQLRWKRVADRWVFMPPASTEQAAA